MTAIIAALPKVRSIPGWRCQASADQIADPTVDDARFDPQPGPLDPREAVAEIDRCLPKGWEVANSIGHCAFFTAQLHDRRPEHFNVIREFGAIGNGLSYAIGVAAAKPDSTVVVLDCDGSLMMHAQELETLRRHGLRVLVCVLNDSAHWSEIHKMQVDGISQEGGRHGGAIWRRWRRDDGLFMTASLKCRAGWSYHLVKSWTVPIFDQLRA